MSLSRSKRLALALAGAAALTLGSAGISAASSDGGTIYNTTGGAAVWFKAYGDHVWVKDIEADGHSAVGLSYVPYDGIDTENWVTGGNGTTVDFNYDFTENAYVYYRACVGESGTGDYFSCSSWYVAVA
ncbi:hypothetical protein [Streptomyces geranii]|uniref:hypothetical protein n=1 Tax=Streptomyces geranii TaxID=2058923 RepID=UPI000D047CC4|nr:hypothetical protein [Streptomyces geranii]